MYWPTDSRPLVCPGLWLGTCLAIGRKPCVCRNDGAKSVWAEHWPCLLHAFIGTSPEPPTDAPGRSFQLNLVRYKKSSWKRWQLSSALKKPYSRAIQQCLGQSPCCLVTLKILHWDVWLRWTKVLLIILLVGFGRLRAGQELRWLPHSAVLFRTESGESEQQAVSLCLLCKESLRTFLGLPQTYPGFLSICGLGASSEHPPRAVTLRCAQPPDARCTHSFISTTSRLDQGCGNRAAQNCSPHLQLPWAEFRLHISRHSERPINI